MSIAGNIAPIHRTVNREAGAYAPASCTHTLTKGMIGSIHTNRDVATRSAKFHVGAAAVDFANQLMFAAATLLEGDREARGPHAATRGAGIEMEARTFQNRDIHVATRGA